MRDGANGGNVLGCCGTVDTVRSLGMEMAGDGQLQAGIDEIASTARALPLSPCGAACRGFSRFAMPCVALVNATVHQQGQPDLTITAWFHHGGDSSGCSKAAWERCNATWATTLSWLWLARRRIFPQAQTSHVVGRHWKPPGNNYQIIGQQAGDFRARGRRAKASQKQLKVQGPRETTIPARPALHPD